MCDATLNHSRGLTAALFSLRLCYAVDCLQHFRVPVKAEILAQALAEAVHTKQARNQ